MKRAGLQLNRFASRAVVITTAVLITGCGKQMEDFVRGAIGLKLDFQKTEILNSGIVPADGTSPQVVVLQLKNSDNTSVSNYKPTYGVTASLGVVTSACTTSDANGISVCIVKSIVPGTKTFTLTNAKVGLTKDLQFGAPTGFQRTSLSSGSRMTATTPQGSIVQFSLGRPMTGTKLTTAGGYKVTFGLQGVAK